MFSLIFFFTKFLNISIIYTGVGGVKLDFDKLMEYQNLMQQRLRTEQQIDKKIELLTIINHLTMGPKNIVQKEQIMIEAVSRGFSEEEVDTLLNQLIKENIIYESSPGYIKKR